MTCILWDIEANAKVQEFTDHNGDVIYRYTGMLDFIEVRRKLLPALDAITPWGGLDGN